MKGRAAAFSLVLLFAASWAAAQQPLARDDFAYGMDLTVSGSSAVCSLILPAEVYQGCTRPDLGDLRVFNASGPVPHLLRPQTAEQSARPPQSLPFFPLFSTAGSSAPELGIAIGSSGALIALRPGRTDGSSVKTVAAYIVDASGLKRRADWLELFWAGQSGDFSAAVRVEGSDDLNSWQIVAPAAALAELNFGGHDLLRRRIRQRIQAKYLRIAWPPGRDGVTLTAVMAGHDQEAQAMPRTRLALAGRPDIETASGRTAWLYSTGGVFPVDQIGIRLPEQNSLAEMAVFSKANEQDKWQRRTALLVWQLTVHGTRLSSESQPLALTADRLWRLETAENIGNTAPLLELGWLPGQLLFMAQGEGPYTLAYGRAGLPPARSAVEQLLKAMEPFSGNRLIETVQAGPQKILGGKKRREPAREIPWRAWLLWAALLAGVLAVGAMAFKLFRDMNRPKTSG